MGLEVSYNENYCLEGRAERRTGATEGEDGVMPMRALKLLRAWRGVVRA